MKRRPSATSSACTTRPAATPTVLTAPAGRWILEDPIAEFEGVGLGRKKGLLHALGSAMDLGRALGSRSGQGLWDQPAMTERIHAFPENVKGGRTIQSYAG